MKKNLSLLYIFLSFWIPQLALAGQQINSEKIYRYDVIHITDGDTFVATDGNIRFRVRIAGMDAPEAAQSFGKLATQELASLLNSGELTLRPVGKGTDSFGRVLGIVY